MSDQEGCRKQESGKPVKSRPFSQYFGLPPMKPFLTGNPVNTLYHGQLVDLTLHHWHPTAKNCPFTTGGPERALHEVLLVTSRDIARGFDHGVGHPLLLLYDAKAPLGKNSNYFNGLGHDLSNPSISLF